MSPTSCWFLEYRKIPASKTKYLWNRNKKSSFKNWLYPEDITGSVNIRQDGRGGVLTLCQPFSGHFLLLRRYPSQIPGMVNSWGLSPPVCNSIWQSSITSQSLIIYMQHEWESTRFEVHWLVLTLCDTTVHIKYKTQCSNRINWSLFSTNCHQNITTTAVRKSGHEYPIYGFHTKASIGSVKLLGTDHRLTCLDWRDDSVLLLREWVGFHVGEFFSRPLASDWLRFSADPYESILEKGHQTVLPAAFGWSSGETRCNLWVAPWNVRTSMLVNVAPNQNTR